MGNNNFNTAYGRHLANITTPITRFDEEQRSRMPNISTHARLPSFDNFIRPMAAPARQPIQVDQQTSCMKNSPTLASVPTKGTPEMDNIAHPSAIFPGASLASSSSQPVHHLQRRIPTMSTVGPLATSSAISPTGAGLLTSSAISHDERAAIPSSHCEENVEGQDPGQVHNDPPIGTLDEDLHNHFHSRELRNRPKNSKDKIHETLKKTLEKALNFTNGGIPQGRTHVPKTSQIHTGCTPASRDEFQEEDTIENDFTPTMMSQEFQPPRRLFGETGLIALGTARLGPARLRNRGILSTNRAPPADSPNDPKQIHTARDPVLAASLNSLALEYANLSRSSSAIPSLLKKLTGKRRRDPGQVIRKPDCVSSTAAHPNLFSGTEVTESPAQLYGFLNTTEVETIPDNQKDGIPAIVGPRGEAGMNSTSMNLENIKNQTTDQSPCVQEADQNFQNDLDFLASVVLSQEVQQRNGSKYHGHPNQKNYSSSVSGQETSTQDDVDRTTPGVSGPQVMHLNRLMADNINSAAHSPIPADQLSHIRDRERHQQLTHGALVSGDHELTTRQTAERHQSPNIEENVQAPQSHETEEEPKSEISYIVDANPAELARHIQTESSRQKETAQQTGEKLFGTDDCITPRHVNSHLLQPDETSPAEQSSFPPFLTSNRSANEMVEPSQGLKNGVKRTPRATISKYCQRKLVAGEGNSLKLFKSSRGIVPSFLAEGDERTQVNLTQIRLGSQTFSSSSTLERTSKQLKTSSDGRGCAATDEITAAPKCPKSYHLQGEGRPISDQEYALRDGTNAVTHMNDEDVSEITPIGSRLQRFGVHQPRILSHRKEMINESGIREHEANEGSAALDDSRTVAVRTKLPYTFRCDCCGAMFNRRFNLNKHIRNVHYNIRKFKCSMCDERFLQKSHRAAHLLAVHHKLRPFVCHLCAKKFSWLGVLKKHLQAIHKVPIQTTKRARRAATILARRTLSTPDKASPNS